MKASLKFPLIVLSIITLLITPLLINPSIYSLAAPTAGLTERVSVSSTREQGDDKSQYPSISADGRFVAFESWATNLVSGDTNGREDVFVHDRQTGVTERVSVSSTGEQGNGSSWSPSISADERFVAFESWADNLVSGDTNETGDVFVHDRHTGVTERVSVSSTREQGNDESWHPTISADGRFVAFESKANNLVTGDTNKRYDIFVHDRQTSVTRQVSVSTTGEQGNDHSINSFISADGRFVAFASDASNLVSGDTNGVGDVFVHNRQTGVTERVSVSSSGEQGNDWYGVDDFPSISAEGRFVAFVSDASNLVSGDTNGYRDIFVHDRYTRVTERVSISSTREQGYAHSWSPSISADGRFVAFSSGANNLVSGDLNDWWDIFIHDRQTGVTTLVSVSSTGEQANLGNGIPSISADGRFVAFSSGANNLVSGDTNGKTDVFVRDRCPGGVCESSPPPPSIDLDVSGALVRLAYYRYQTKQSQPGRTTLEAVVKNNGTQAATGVTVQFFDDNKVLASTTLPTVPAMGEEVARASWVTTQNPAQANLSVRVIPASGQTDMNAANNSSTASTPVFIAYAGSPTDPYRFNPDTFSFRNWELELSDFLEELITYTFYQTPDIYRYIFGPLLYAIAADGGHCYGMAQASIVYWDTPSVKPVAVDSYQMDQSVADVDIRDHHVRQALINFATITKSKVIPSTTSPERAYNGIRQRLLGSSPRPAILGIWPPGSFPRGGHAVVAYKIVEVGSDRYVFIYDNNYPYPPGAGATSLANVFFLTSDGRAFEYQGLSAIYEDAVASDPIRDPEEINAEMHQDVFEFLLRQLIDDERLSIFFSWVAQNALNSAAADRPETFMISDDLGRRIGLEQGVSINEIPGAELSDWETGFYLRLPADRAYTLTTVGTGAAENVLSLAIPVGPASVQQTVFSNFSIPAGVAASLSFSQETDNWRIVVPGSPDVPPTTDHVETLTRDIFIPFILRPQ